MLEPKTCKYVLTIESPSLCKLINGPIDEYGIFIINPDSDIKNKGSSSSSKSELIDKMLNIDEHPQTESTIHYVEKNNDDKKKMNKIEL